jgi:hypothetical protein
MRILHDAGMDAAWKITDDTRWFCRLLFHALGAGSKVTKWPRGFLSVSRKAAATLHGTQYGTNVDHMRGGLHFLDE